MASAQRLYRIMNRIVRHLSHSDVEKICRFALFNSDEKRKSAFRVAENKRLTDFAKALEDADGNGLSNQFHFNFNPYPLFSAAYPMLSASGISEIYGDQIGLAGRPVYHGLAGSLPLSVYHASATGSFDATLVQYDEEVDAVRLFGRPIYYGPGFTPLADGSESVLPCFGKESQDGMDIRIEMAGAIKENVLITVEHDNTILIKVPQGGRMVSCRIQLPEQDFMMKDTSAKMRNGVLMLFVPKRNKVFRDVVEVTATC